MKKRNYGNQGDLCSFHNVDRILTPVHMNGRDWSWFLQTRGQHMPWRMLWRWKADRMKGLNSWVKPWKTGRYDFFSCSTCALNFWTREISGYFVCNVCLFNASPPPLPPWITAGGLWGGGWCQWRHIDPISVNLPSFLFYLPTWRYRHYLSL